MMKKVIERGGKTYRKSNRFSKKSVARMERDFLKDEGYHTLIRKNHLGYTVYVSKERILEEKEERE